MVSDNLQSFAREQRPVDMSGWGVEYARRAAVTENLALRIEG
jgi:hypothetical protein